MVVVKSSMQIKWAAASLPTWVDCWSRFLPFSIPVGTEVVIGSDGYGFNNS